MSARGEGRPWEAWERFVTVTVSPSRCDLGGKREEGERRRKIYGAAVGVGGKCGVLLHGFGFSDC